VLLCLQVTFTLNITVAYGAPSCFARQIVLTSGYFEPAIIINQGDTLRVCIRLGYVLRRGVLGGR
jgi:hypothetical protein